LFVLNPLPATGAVVWDASYRPFGDAAVSGSVAFNLRFPGQYFDAETGLAYNTFRDYDAGLGRYLESDPIGLGGGWNTYAYVGGNPVMFIDPEGQILIPLHPFPNGNGGTGGCPVMYNATCVYACQMRFQEDEEWRLDKLLNDLTNCRVNTIGRARVTCNFGVVQFDFALERYNRRRLVACLKKCGSA